MTYPKAHDYIARIVPFTTSGTKSSQPVKIDLTTNQETLGPSPKVIALYESLAPDLHTYPDVEATRLRQAISKHFNLNPDNIIGANGSEEILYALPRAYCAPEDEVIFSKGSFPTYKIATYTVGAKPVEVDPIHFRINVDGILKAITPRTKIIMIDNPGNPYSTYLTKAEIEKLIENTPSHILILLDGAYAEYVTASDFTVGFEYVEKYPNVVISRTFSKFYGLAGMRIGWAYADNRIIETLRRLKAPFNVGTLAQQLAITALDDATHSERVKETNYIRREAFRHKLEKMGFHVPESQCNFLSPSLADPKIIDGLISYLADCGIAVRSLKGQGFPNHFRFSLSYDDNMKALFDEIEVFLKQSNAQLQVASYK